MMTASAATASYHDYRLGLHAHQPRQSGVVFYAARAFSITTPIRARAHQRRLAARAEGGVEPSDGLDAPSSLRRIKQQ